MSTRPHPNEPGAPKHTLGDERGGGLAHGLTVAFGLSLILLSVLVLPVWRPLLLAAATAALLASWHDRFAAALGGRRTISALLFTVAVVLLILIPIAITAVSVIEQALQLAALVKRTVREGGVAELLKPLPDQVEHYLLGRYGDFFQYPRSALAGMNIWSRASGAASIALGVLASASQLVLQVALMLIALFFFLRDGASLVAWLRRNIPLPSREFDHLMDDLRGVSKSVVAGNLATGLVQAIVATVGYVIAGVPSPILFGVLTFLASFIPSVGTAMAALPAVGLLLVIHRNGWAIFLGAWTVLLVGTVDNVLRPIFMRGGASHLHGAAIFFSLMGGILAFGAMGLVVGPMGLVFFMAMAKAVTRSWKRSSAGSPGALP